MRRLARVDTCDEAIAYIADLASQGLTLLEMGDSEFGVVSQALDTISTDCSPEQITEFFDQPDIADFLG